MSRAAFTLRLPSEERHALESLSRIEGRPMNQLLNEAIRIYLQREGSKERTLGDSLERLRQYRERDPEYKQAIAAFVEAEATLDDPLEGTVIRGGKLGHSPSGPAQSRIEELLCG